MYAGNRNIYLKNLKRNGKNVMDSMALQKAVALVRCEAQHNQTRALPRSVLDQQYRGDNSIISNVKLLCHKLGAHYLIITSFHFLNGAQSGAKVGLVKLVELAVRINQFIIPSNAF